MFLDEIGKITKLPYDEIFNEYKITNIGGKILHVQNFLKLQSFSKELIVLKIKKNEINIAGSNLKISQLSSKSIYVSGNIAKTYLSNLPNSEVKEDNESEE